MRNVIFCFQLIGPAPRRKYGPHDQKSISATGKWAGSCGRKIGRITKTVFPRQFSRLGPRRNTVLTKTESRSPCGSSQMVIGFHLPLTLLHEPGTVSMFKVSQHVPSQAGCNANAQKFPRSTDSDNNRRSAAISPVALRNTKAIEAEIDSLESAYSISGVS